MSLLKVAKVTSCSGIMISKQAEPCSFTRVSSGLGVKMITVLLTNRLPCIQPYIKQQTLVLEYMNFDIKLHGGCGL